MFTSIPHTQSISDSILEDVISHARIFAEEYANQEASQIFPVIMPHQKWLEHWDFAWNSAISYSSERLTTYELYTSHYSPNE